MPVEIERKFLVSGDGWRAAGDGIRYRQGYLAVQDGVSVRVRTSEDDAWLTIKGETSGASRAEFEYPIPQAHARELLDTLCILPIIDKTRYCIEHCGRTWEVDEFAGANAGLVIAEVELDTEDQEIDLPDWVGEEVTGDPRYYNASLARNPYTTW